MPDLRCVGLASAAALCVLSRRADVAQAAAASTACELSVAAGRCFAAVDAPLPRVLSAAADFFFAPAAGADRSMLSRAADRFEPAAEPAACVLSRRAEPGFAASDDAGWRPGLATDVRATLEPCPAASPETVRRALSPAADTRLRAGAGAGRPVLSQIGRASCRERV